MRRAIRNELKIQGPNADLNHIDVSLIDDMSELFKYLDIENIKIDTSLWDKSNMKYPNEMKAHCNRKDFDSDDEKQWNDIGIDIKKYIA